MRTHLSSIMDKTTLHNLLDFDIDRYLNPYIPPNRLRLLPQPFGHFLGYRSQPEQPPLAVVQWICTLISTVAGLCVVGATLSYAPGITRYHGPVTIASFGASAVLDYNSIRSPLGQPRNTLIGQTLSAIVGVAISKLFQLNPNFTEIEWVAGAVAAACASVVMSMTNTVHPPGGATAVLACTNASIIGLGWMFVPLVLLAGVEMLCVALMSNNILRQYPVYWWTAKDTGGKLFNTREIEGDEHARLEKQGSASTIHNQASAQQEGQVTSRLDAITSQRILERESENHSSVENTEEVCITPYEVRLPSHIQLGDEEVSLLKRLQERLRTQSEIGD